MEIQWPLAIFTLLAGGAGWLLVWSCVNQLRGTVTDDKLFSRELIVIAILAVCGGISSALHLSHVDRMMGALSHPSSAIFTEAVMVGLVVLLCIVFLVLLRRDMSAGTRKALSIVGIVFGVVISFATGSGYMMISQPNWNTLLMPLSYLVTASAFGSALYLLFVDTWKGDEAAHGKAVGEASKYALVTGLVAAVVVVIYAIAQGVLSLSGEPALFAVCLIGCLGVAAVGAGAGKAATGVALPSVGVICGVAASLGFRCFMFAAGTGLLTFIASPDAANHFFATI